MNRDRRAWLVLALATAVLAAAGGLLLFSTFMVYDDEGYVLFSYKNFSEHGALYRDVYSQYGPFPYLLYAALHAVGVPITSTVGRLVTLAAWAGTAAGLAALVWRATRFLPAALFSLAALFVYLWIMSCEPSHPGGLIAVVVAALACTGYGMLSLDRPRGWGVLGCGLALLTLTKINVGAFAGFATLAFWGMYAAQPTLRRISPWLIALAMVILPLALMRTLLGTPWVNTYAALFVLAALPAVGAAARAAPGRLRWRALRALCLGGALTAALISAAVVFSGSRPADLLAGVLLNPLQHPGHFSLAFPWPAGAAVIGSVSAAAFLAAMMLSRRPTWASRVDRTVAAGRLLLAVALGCLLLRFPDIGPDRSVMTWGGMSLWLFLWPLTGTAATPARAARAWLGLLFLTQWLHAYPVPGSQIAWGTFLAIPLALLGAADAAAWLQADLGLDGRFVARLGLAAGLVLTLASVSVGVRFVRLGDRFFGSRPLGLPGAEALRLPDLATAEYQIVTLNAKAHADILFSLPGMFSLNLWTGLPAPTLANVTHWFSLLDDEQQRAIIQVLEADPRACVVRAPGHVTFLAERQLAPKGLLNDYIGSHYVRAFGVPDFDFLVRRGRTVAAFGTAQVYQRRAGEAPAPLGTLVRMNVLLPPDSLVGSIALVPLDQAVPAELVQPQRSRLEVTPIDEQGRPTGPARPAGWPLRLNGPTDVDLYFDPVIPRLQSGRTGIALRSPEGRELALLLVLPP